MEVSSPNQPLQSESNRQRIGLAAEDRCMRLVLLGRSMLDSSDQSDFGYWDFGRSDAEHGELTRLSHSIPLLPKGLTDALNRKSVSLGIVSCPFGKH